MKLLETYARSAPAQLSLKMSADNNVMAYAAFVVHLPDHADVAQWPSGTLEGAGGQVALTTPTGYLIVVSSIINADKATFHATLALDGTAVFDDDVTIPAKETFGWSVAIS